jgi:hypothetical protein
MIDYQPVFCGDEMEELFEELSKFARKNRKALKPAEQWLNEFDGNIDDAWNVARNSTHIDWRKIVLVVEWTLDGGVECLLNTILSGNYTTREHPNIYLIRNALEEGRKAVADEKTAKQKNLTPTGQNSGKAENPAEIKRDKASSTTQKPPKMVEDTITIWGLTINWKACWNNFKKRPLSLKIIVISLVLIAIIAFVFRKQLLNIGVSNSGNHISTVSNSSGNSSPAITTTGPNSSVIVNYSK